MLLLPSGRTTLIFRTDIRLFMSLWMLSATPGYWEEYGNNRQNQCRQRKTEVVKETEIECVWIPGSSWRFLYCLLTLRDAPGQWKLQQMVCLQRTIASLASLVPVPPPELSTQSDPHRRSSYSMTSFKDLTFKIYIHQAAPVNCQTNENRLGQTSFCAVSSR